MLDRIGWIFLLALVAMSCEDGKESKLAEAPLVISENLSFWGDVAPIVFAHCTPCHHDGGAGPFPLTRFSDLDSRLKTIRLAVADGYMPPWPADPAYRHFKNEKVLSPQEAATLIAWIDQGGREGVKSEQPLVPITLADRQLGEPDKIIKLQDTVKIRGNARDYFALVRVNFELARDTMLRAIEFVPGNKQLVHHVNAQMLNYAPARKEFQADNWMLDVENITALEGYKQLNLTYPDGSYPPMLVSAFNYLPGVEPASYPNGIGNIYVSRKATFLLNTLHYGPSPIDTFDLSEIHLYYADQKPDRALREIQMGTQGETAVVPEFIIPADSICRFTTSYTLPETISALTINPHMHLLGKTFKAWAVSPTGADTIPLIHIPDWDFRWQYFYTFEQIQVIPAGYTITAEASFDNTMGNPLNPNNPPITLRTGGKHMKTTDEMFQFFITYVPYRSGDEYIKL